MAYHPLNDSNLSISEQYLFISKLYRSGFARNRFNATTNCCCALKYRFDFHKRVAGSTGDPWNVSGVRHHSMRNPPLECAAIHNAKYVAKCLFNLSIRWSNVSSMWFCVWNHTLTDLCFLYMWNGIGISVNTLIIHCDTLAT